MSERACGWLSKGALIVSCLASWSGVAMAQSEGLRVGVDPVTRQIRPVTTEESKSLDAVQAAKAVRGEAGGKQLLSSRSKTARGLTLGAEHLSSLTVQKTADGQLAAQCSEGGDHAGHQHAEAGAARLEAERE